MPYMSNGKRFSKSELEAKDRIRMLVLETDEPHPDTNSRRGSYGDIFDHLFKKAGDSHDPPLGIDTVIHYVVEDNGGHVPTVEEVDEMGKDEDGWGIHAILITGSMFDAHGDQEWILKLVKLIQDLWSHRPDIRFSGVCFGHQLLCRALGSKVGSTKGGAWELAHTRISLTHVGQQLFNTSEPYIHLHQMHQDHVFNEPTSETTDLIPEGLKAHVWGSTETTPVQGVYIRERLFTSQGHLGFDEKQVKAEVEQRVESGSIENHDHAAEAKESARLDHDGEVVAGAILRFFHGDDKDIC